MKLKSTLTLLLSCCLLLFFSPQKTHGQENDTTLVGLYDLDLEALMNIDVYSVSKKSESLFDALLSASVLTREEIQKSGAVTIPEVLRLVPGLIVREITTGNYDVHIRGNDDIQGTKLNYAQNTISLVMIDNRIVYSYFQGGTFWETLPVSVNDIERIEVVRGPSSALYGPNAVSGVIHIITTKKDLDDDKLHARANLQAGTLNSKIASASVGYGGIKNLDFRVSGNYTFLDRSQDDYYSYYLERYTTVDSLAIITKPGPYPGAPADTILPRAHEYYPNPANAMDKYGANLFANYKLNESVSFDISLGLQGSQAQTVYIDDAIVPMNTRKSNSSYINFQADAYGFIARASYMTGGQNLALGLENPNFHYDMNHLDAILEYDYSYKNLTIRPGISYQKCSYDVSPYSSPTNKSFFEGNKELSTIAAHIRAEYLFLEKWKLMAALRYDNYNKPDDPYLSYQFATSYKVSDKSMLRAVISRANQGPFMLDIYSNLDIMLNPMYNIHLTIEGNENIKLPVMDMLELGFRNKLTSKIQTDFEFFYSKMKDFTYPVASPQNPRALEYQNLPVKSTQVGMTGSIDFILSNKLRVKAWGTLQNTILTDVEAEINDSTKIMVDEKHLWTPTFFGGALVDYSPIPKLNFFTSIYFYSQETFDNLEPGHKLAKIQFKEKATVNLKISYKVWKNNAVFFNARNLLFNDGPEFAYGDKTYGMYLLGLDLSF
ncbi:MAG: hypothetical protein B6D64_14340 [Bacteroidetes bacterium 4484_276]|nr:MAG: hypothetical protein B6D64_14340 [Bacteroidetes bacterium 4484_276]